MRNCTAKLPATRATACCTRHTQQWDPAGRLQEQLLGRSDDQSIQIKHKNTATRPGADTPQ